MFKTLKYLIAALVLTVPAIAFADATVNPASSNAWNMFTLGNGKLMASALMGISSLMDSPGYRSMLTLVAIMGVLVMAIIAGFSPTQMGPKFLGYVIAAWLTLYVATGMHANVMIHDPITNYHHTIQNVPAALAVPAALISSTGEWTTRAIETSLQVFDHYPPSMQITKGGRFNIANQLFADISNLHINDAYLKSSVSNYIADCVTPEIAAGRVDANALRTSKDLWGSIRSEHPSLYTHIQLPGEASPNTGASAFAEDGALTCKDAYLKLTVYFEEKAPQMLATGAGAWGTTGTLTPLSSLIDDAAMWMSTTNGGAGSAGMTGAQMIKQQAAIGLLSHSFTDAASRANNSEMTTSLAIAQAEQSQKSSWVTASAIFTSIMGYIYSMLQAFMFLVTPIMLVGVLIPVFGKKMLGNFLKILIWLALWEPMLAIISFMSASVGQQEIGNVFGPSGLTYANAAVISEFANTSQIAAGFMATLIPMIAWSLVQGGMAFTEFISHGLGSSFASQSGGMAATGNVALNSQSMNNQAMNAHAFQQRSTFGDADINAGRGGAISWMGYNGGMGQNMNGAAVTNSASFSNGTNRGTTVSDSAGVSGQQAMANQAMHSAMDANMGSILMSAGQGAGNTNGHTDGTSGSDRMNVNQTIGTSAGTSFGNGVSAEQAKSIEGGLMLTGKALGAAIEKQGRSPAAINAAAGAVEQTATAAGDAAAQAVAAQGGSAAEQAAASQAAQARTASSMLSGLGGAAGAVANAIKGSANASLRNALKTEAGNKWATTDDNSFGRGLDYTKTEGHNQAYQEARNWLTQATHGRTGTVSDTSTTAFSDQLAAQDSLMSARTQSSTGQTLHTSGFELGTSNRDVGGMTGLVDVTDPGMNWGGHATGSGLTGADVATADAGVRAQHAERAASFAQETATRQAAAEAGAASQITAATNLEQQIKGSVGDFAGNGVEAAAQEANANNTAAPSVANVTNMRDFTRMNTESTITGVTGSTNSFNPLDMQTPAGGDGTVAKTMFGVAGGAALAGGVADALLSGSGPRLGGPSEPGPRAGGGASKLTFAAKATGVGVAGYAGYEAGTWMNENLLIDGRRMSDYGADALYNTFGPKTD